MVIVLLMASALMSGSEVAFFSLTPNDIKKLESDASPPARRILALRDRPQMLLATILICNSAVNIGIVVVTDLFISPNFTSQYEIWAATIGISPEAINFLVTVVGITFILVLFGEVTPKIYANVNNLKLAMSVSGIFIVLAKLCRPLSYILERSSSIIETRLARRNAQINYIPVEDIEHAIELTVKTEKEEVDILKNIAKFGEVAVKQIMCPRSDVTAVDQETPFHELMNQVKEAGYSRLPVYQENFDHVVGILYVKELLGYLDESESFQWNDLVRKEVLYVPESKKISDLLKQFQKEKTHMAIVVDEYGGTSGIVTLEDIMEEIIGDIRDEFDDEREVNFEKIDDWNYIFDGKTSLQDIARILDINVKVFDEKRGEADSIAGLVLEQAGNLPPVDSEYYCGELLLKTIAVSPRRIEKIKITLPEVFNE